MNPFLTASRVQFPYDRHEAIEIGADVRWHSGVRWVVMSTESQSPDQEDHPMLVLVRKPSESIMIGRDITVTVLNVQGGRVRIGITAPRHMRVDREELRERIEQERQELADADCDE